MPSSRDTNICIAGPTMSGDANVPGPGRRPSSHAAPISDAITSHTASVNDNPVRTRTAPMNTSSGPGPRRVHNITATPAAMITDPTTSSPTRTERRSNVGIAPSANTAAMAPARLSGGSRNPVSTGAPRPESGRDCSTTAELTPEYRPTATVLQLEMTCRPTHAPTAMSARVAG